MIALLPIVSFGQSKMKSFEAHYSLSYKGFDKEELEDMPNTTITRVAGNNSKQIIRTAHLATQVIANYDSIFLANLSDIDGDKIGVRYDAEGIKENLSGLKVSVVPSKDTRTILGYKCKKHEISILDIETNETMSETVYVTDLLGGKNIYFYLYPELSGFILRSEKREGKETVTSEVTKIMKKNISNAEFNVSSAYELMSEKEYLKELDD